MSDTREPLWAVHVQGPDDLVPVASYAEALALACTFNDWWREHKARKPLTENDPRMWAVPVQYDGTADAHAEWVKNPSPDYAPFFAPTESGEGLLPCPHCGEADEIYPAYRLDKNMRCVEPAYAIDCLGCGHDFTPRPGVDAKSAWNRRPALPLHRRKPA